jgi:hypothetical protein
VSLTGLPLLVLSVLVAVNLFVATVVVWSRGGRWRPAIRLVAILACEAVTLWVVGLAVNRSLDLYPSWSALLGNVPAAVNAQTQPATNLERWLSGKAAQGEREGVAFDWNPPGESGWHLSARPSVYVPPSYFHDKTARFPVVVVVAPKNATPARAGWFDHKTGPLVRATVERSAPAVVVFVRADGPEGVTKLATTIPARLEKDLRVTLGGWALIGVGGANAPALDVMAAQAGRRYRGVALLADGSQPLQETVVSRARKLPAGTGRLFVAADRVVAEEDAHAYPTASVAEPKPEQRVAAALRWAYGLLSPSLTPAVTAAAPVSPGPPPGR